LQVVIVNVISGGGPAPAFSSTPAAHEGLLAVGEGRAARSPRG